ncbi:Transportin-1 [Allomyces javanicus]|nr:Transportin-1 [Allomyces javanicus]
MDIDTVHPNAAPAAAVPALLPSTTAWEPHPQGLAQLADLLHAGATSTDNAVQRRVHADLQHLATTIPDFPCYLAYLLSPSSNEATTLRCTAGYALKAYLLVRAHTMHPALLADVQARVLATLDDTDPAVTNVAGTLIALLVSRAKVERWPAALARLVDLLADPTHAAFLPALKAVDKVCEDDADDLLHSPLRPLAALLPRLVALVAHPDPPVVATTAIHSVTELLHAHTPDVDACIPTFVPLVLTRAMDPHPALRRAVCACIVKLLEFRADALAPVIHDVVQYMLLCSRDADDALALEACECWIVLAEHASSHALLAGALPALVPVLLDRMVYSEDELIELGGDANDAHVPDRDQDINPRQHRRRRTHETGGGGTTPRVAHARLDVPVEGVGAGMSRDADDEDSGMEPPPPLIGPNGEVIGEDHAGDLDGDAEDEEADSDEDEDESDEEDDSDDDDDDDDAVTQWNLRKCAAAALDMLANTFKAPVADTLLPLLQNRLTSTDWKVREAGILALGAIADGCMESITVHLPVLVPYLLASLNDHALVRSIASWTLSRYANWVIYDAPNASDLLARVVQELTRNLTHANKKVQEVTCSTLATFEEAAGENIVPYLGTILPTLVQCFHVYQQRNLLVLYDCIGTLAEVTGSALGQPACVQLLLPALMHKWHVLRDDDKDLLPLFECLASVVIPLGQGFAAHAHQVFERCLRIIQTTYQSLSEYQQGRLPDEPDRDFYIVSLDLMSGVVQSRGTAAEELVSRYQNQVLTVLNITLNDPAPTVKQSAMGLFGDLVVHAYGVVQPYAPTLLHHTVSYIQHYDEPAWLRLCNNAVWVVGELTDKLAAPAFADTAGVLSARLLPLFVPHGRDHHARAPPAMLVENCALTLGRLGNVAPTILAADLDVFAAPWCAHMARLRASPEKDAAVRGFLEVVRVNPRAIVPILPRFVETLAACAADHVDEVFRGVLAAFRAHVGEDVWAATMREVAPQAAAVVQARRLV